MSKPKVIFKMWGGIVNDDVKFLRLIVKQAKLSLKRNLYIHGWPTYIRLNDTQDFICDLLNNGELHYQDINGVHQLIHYDFADPKSIGRIQDKIKELYEKCR